MSSTSGWQRDPIALFGRKLVDEGELTSHDLDEIGEAQRRLLDETLVDVLASPRPTEVQMFAHVTAHGG